MCAHVPQYAMGNVYTSMYTYGPVHAHRAIHRCLQICVINEVQRWVVSDSGTTYKPANKQMVTTIQPLHHAMQSATEITRQLSNQFHNLINQLKLILGDAIAIQLLWSD